MLDEGGLWECSSEKLSGAVQFSEIAVEGTKRHVFCLPRDFEHEAIRESNHGLTAKCSKCGGYGFGILYCQVFVVQQHCDGSCDLGCGAYLRKYLADLTKRLTRFALPK